MVLGKRFCLIVLLLGWGGGCVTTSKQDIRKANSFYRLGVAHSNKGKLRQSLALLVQAEKLHPGSYWIQEALGGVLMRMQRPKMAQVHYLKALKIRPESPRAWNNVGSCYMARRKWKKAIKAYRKALNNILYQTPCVARSNLGWAYHQIGEKKKALRNLRHSVRECYRLCQGYRLLGLVTLHHKRYKEAHKSFLQLVKRCKKYPEGYYWLGRTLLAQKKAKQATAPLQQCLKLSHKQSALHQACQRLLRKARKKGPLLSSSSNKR